MKHKFFTVLLAAALALGTCFGLAACSDNGDEHEHTYTVENKCSVCGEEWEHTPFDAFDFTPVTLNGVEGYDARFGEYKYYDITYDPQTGSPILGDPEIRGTLFEGEEIVFPYGYNGLPVISIGRFQSCTSETVKTITVPKSVLSWGFRIPGQGLRWNGAFNCEALETLNLPDGLLLETTQTVEYPSPTTIYYLTSETLFSLGGIGYVDCPLWSDPGHRASGALYIGNYLFDTDFEETVETFTVREGTRAILSCKGAENVIIPDSVETIAARAFTSNGTLKSITLGKGVKTIGNSAFYNCAQLTDITIPDSVTELGSEAFMRCEGLTSITIPSSITKIGSRAFISCTNLTDIRFAGTMEAWQAIEKRYDWDLATGNYTVTCANGTVAKETDAT